MNRITQTRKTFKLLPRFVSADELRERIMRLLDNNPFAELPQLRRNFVIDHQISPKLFENCLETLVSCGALEVEMRCFQSDDGVEDWQDSFYVNWSKFFESEVAA